MGLRLIAYLRVSSHGQLHNTSFATQLAAIRSFCHRSGHTIISCRKEQKTASEKSTRAVFQKALNDIQANKADGLVVFSLDRFARSAFQGLSTARQLHQNHKQLLIVDVALDTTTPIGQCMLTVLLAFAELERNMLLQRVMDGKERIKEQNGYVCGRPPYGWIATRVNGRKGLRPHRREQKTYNLIQRLRHEGLSCAKIAAYLNLKKIPAKSGGEWEHKAVYNVLHRNNLLATWALSQITDFKQT